MKNIQEFVSCNLCGEDSYEELYNSSPLIEDQQQMADFVASTDRFANYGRIVKCRHCGLAYTNPRPSQKRLIESYSKVEDHEYANEDSSRSMNAHLSLHTIKKFCTAGSLLDIGCSTGYFLNAARLDFDTYGVEPSRWACGFARDRLKLNVKESSFEEWDFAEGCFDVVSLNDVIEHLSDPLGSLRKAHSILKPGGLLYLVTPNIDSLSARVLRSRWWGFRPAHVYYFSPQTISDMMKKCGLEPVLVRSYGRIFTCGYWVGRLKNYPRLIYRTALYMIEKLDIQDKFLYINTRDSMEVCALKT